MSNYYARVAPRILISRSSDYSNPETRPDTVDAYELTPDEYMQRSVQVDTTLTSLDLDEFTSIDSITVKNKSTTSAVNVLLTLINDSSSYSGLITWTDNVAGTADTITTSSGDFKLAGGVPGGFVRVTGGSNSQAGRYMIYSLTSSVITLAINDELPGTTGADAGAPTLQFESDVCIRIPADSVLVLGASVRPASGLSMQAVTTASDVDVIVTGT